MILIPAFFILAILIIAIFISVKNGRHVLMNPLMIFIKIIKLR